MSTSESPILPHSLEAEAAVISGILRHPRLFYTVHEVEPSDFYDPLHLAIFQAMIDLDSANHPIDTVSVVDQMRANGSHTKLMSLGGARYLSNMQPAGVDPGNIDFHARTIRSKAMKRRLIEACQAISTRAYRDNDDVEDQFDEAVELIHSIAEPTRPASFEPISTVMKTAFAAVETRYGRKQAITGVPSGYRELDKLTAGFQRSDLIIIAARPSMGKTSLVMNMAQNAAIESKVPILFFSLEMSREALVERMLCSEARVDSTKLRGGFLDTKDWINITRAASKIAEAPIWIDDSGAPTLLEIRAKCHRWRPDPNIFTRDQLGMVVIDYLQLIQGRSGLCDQNREREISEISRGLKTLAKELRVPIVAVSQLNSNIETRGGKDNRPRLPDLRASGAIEQAADVIAFIYRDEVYNMDTPDKGIAEVLLAKQRCGPLGTVRLAFLDNILRFDNLMKAADYQDNLITRPISSDGDS